MLVRSKSVLKHMVRDPERGDGSADPRWMRFSCFEHLGSRHPIGKAWGLWRFHTVSKTFCIAILVGDGADAPVMCCLFGDGLHQPFMQGWEPSSSPGHLKFMKITFLLQLSMTESSTCSQLEWVDWLCLTSTTVATKRTVVTAWLAPLLLVLMMFLLQCQCGDDGHWQW